VPRGGKRVGETGHGTPSPAKLHHRGKLSAMGEEGNSTVSDIKKNDLRKRKDGLHQNTPIGQEREQQRLPPRLRRRGIRTFPKKDEGRGML